MQHKAFSLIELLIVVLIVGLVYKLSLSNFQRVKEGDTKPTLLTLKQDLWSLPKKKKAELICLDDCTRCTLYIDGEADANASKKYEEFLDEKVEVYRYDQNYGLVELKDRIFFNSEGKDEQICFSLSVDNKGVSEQIMVEYKDKYYDFSPYFTDTQVYRSASELEDIKEHLAQEVLR